MDYSYRFRLYPTLAQKTVIEKTSGCCRFVYNCYLSMKKGLYDTKTAAMNYCACSKDMTILKGTLLWLRDVDSTALQSSLKDLDAACQDFFRRVKQKEKPQYLVLPMGSISYPCAVRMLRLSDSFHPASFALIAGFSGAAHPMTGISMPLSISRRKDSAS